MKKSDIENLVTGAFADASEDYRTSLIDDFKKASNENGKLDLQNAIAIVNSTNIALTKSVLINTLYKLLTSEVFSDAVIEALHEKE